MLIINKDLQEVKQSILKELEIMDKYYGNYISYQEAWNLLEYKPNDEMYALNKITLEEIEKRLSKV